MTQPVQQFDAPIRSSGVSPVPPVETPSTAPLSTEQQNQISERLGTLERQIQQNARNHGQTLAASSPNQAELTRLNTEFETLLTTAISDIEGISGRPLPESARLQIRERLTQGRENVSNGARMQEILSVVHRHSREHGYAEARQLNDSSYVLPPSVDSYLGGQQTFIDQFLGTRTDSQAQEIRNGLNAARRDGYAEGHRLWTQAWRDAGTLHTAMAGLGTDEDAIFGTLEGKTREQILAIYSAFRTRYRGGDLDVWLEGDLSGSDLTRARTALLGDPTATASSRLYWAMRGLGTDEDLIFSTLQGLNEEQRASVTEHFNRHFAAQYGATDLREALRQELSGHELTRAIALLEGRSADALAAQIRNAQGTGFLWLSNDTDQIFSALQSASEQDRRNLAAAYAAQNPGRTLATDFRNLGGDLAVQADALVIGDRIEADAAALEYAMNGGTGIGCDFPAIRRIFERRSPEDREAIVARWNQRYSERNGHDLSAELRSELSAERYDMALELIENGRMTDAQRVRWAVVGLGTDEEELRQVLSNRTKSNIDAMSEEYQRRYGVSLRDDIMGDVSGDDAFDMAEALRGRPETIAELRAGLVRRREHERSGFLSGIVDLFSAEGSVMDTQLQTSLEHLSQFDPGQQLAELDFVQSTMTATVENLFGSTTDSFRHARHSVSDGVTNGATIAVAVGASWFTAGQSLWLMGLAIGGSSLATRFGLRSLIDGAGYGWEEQGSDVAYSAVDGFTSFAGGALGRRAAESMLQRAAVRALRQTGEEITEQSIARVSVQLLETRGMRILHGAVDAATDGFSSGGLDGLLTSNLEDGTWNDGIGTGVSRLLGNALVGMGTGTTLSGTLGTTVNSAVEGVSHLRSRGASHLSGQPAHLHVTTPIGSTPLPDDLLARYFIPISGDGLGGLVVPTLHGSGDLGGLHLPGVGGESGPVNRLQGRIGPAETVLAGVGAPGSQPHLGAALDLGNPGTVHTGHTGGPPHLSGSFDDSTPISHGSSGFHTDLPDEPMIMHRSPPPTNTPVQPSHQSQGLNRYEQAVREQWLNSTFFDADEIAVVQDVIERGRLRFVELGAEQLRSMDAGGRLFFKEAKIQPEKVANINPPFDPTRIVTGPATGPVILVQHGSGLYAVNGNHRLWVAVHQNPDGHPFYALMLDGFDSYQTAFGFSPGTQWYVDPPVR